MEPSYKTRKIIERWLLWVLLAVLVSAGVAQFTSPLAQALARRDKKDVHLTVLTSPTMQFTYNPASRKAVVSVSAEKSSAQKGKNLPPHKGRYYIPAQPDREAYWENFKHTLSSWRYNPLLALRTGWEYLCAWHDRRTNLTAAEFALLAMELSTLDAADFAVRFPRSAKTHSARKAAPAAPEVQDRAPLAVKDRPIVVEVFNASGKRGLALALTQYLREQNEKGLLRVDVLQYDNYPSYQNKSFIVDYSGRLVQVKQLSLAIGINSEIQSETSANAICDTRIVLGKDFEMPL